MIGSGIYQLLIRVPEDCRIKIGNLGQIDFEKGLYIYTGSAEKNLHQRLARHFRSDKKLFWHIDYLLVQAKIEAYRIEPFSNDLECRRNIKTKNAYPHSRFVHRFGSSDCKCPAHLIYLKE